MKRLLCIVGLVSLLSVSMSPLAMAQSVTDLIKNIKIVSVKSVRIDLPQEKYLIVNVELQNDNDLDLKLAENVEFKFYIQERQPGILLKNIYLGEDVAHKGSKAPILLEKMKITPVEFVVDMESSQEQSVPQTVIHMLNFIGNPAQDPKSKDLFIKAKFDLGFKSDRGWSYGEKLRVEWMFCPEQQDRLPLNECFIEPVE